MVIDDNSRGDRQPRLRRQFRVRQDADADYHKVRRDMPTITQADAAYLFAIALDACNLYAQMNANARRSMALLKVIRDLRRHRTRHHAASKFDDVDLKPFDPRRRRKLQPDEPRTDDDHMPARGNPPSQVFAVIEDAQISHVGQVGVRNVEKAIARASGEHQVAVIERRTRCEPHLARGAINPGGTIRNQFDVLIAIEFVWPEHQAVGPAGALEIGLRKRRPLIGQMPLVIDKGDTLAKTVLTQGDRELKACVPGADDQN